MEIRTGGGVIDLPASFSMEIEDTNPVFNERGSQSLPATVPPTPQNRLLTGFPDLLVTARHPNGPVRRTVVSDGTYMRVGTMNVISASRKTGISFNVGFDNSTAYVAWQNKRLCELATLPVISSGSFNPSGLIEILGRIYDGSDTEHPDLAVFPFAVNKETTGSGQLERVYWEVLNSPDSAGGVTQPTKVIRIIDGEAKEVTVPTGYGVTPLLKVWRLLEIVFADLGMVVKSNPFLEDPDLERLVVMNNTADGVASGKIHYSELVPDCSVSNFLNALWVRFGLVYNVDTVTHTVSLRFIKDIIAGSAASSLDAMATEPGLVSYPEPTYVRLSAGTSIEGAEPPCERFEDFAGDLTGREILQGFDVEKWFDNGAQAIRNGTDWWSPANGENDILGCEIITGRWFRLDTENRLIRKSGSSFFCWDPRPAGMEPLDLSSEDECVPIISVNTVVTNSQSMCTANCYEGYVPGYLFGSRHRHSSIKGSETAKGDDDAEEDTPLAFMFAYTAGGRTFGRVTPEGIVMDKGTPSPRLTLLFQFEDGLFANFWAGYDEFLRHGNRSVEFAARIQKPTLRTLDFLQPVIFRGTRCLIDSLSYSLPSGPSVRVDAKLRVLQTQGDYDIRTEQAIPEFALSGGTLVWSQISTDENEVPENLDVWKLTNPCHEAATIVFGSPNNPFLDPVTDEWRYFGANGCFIINRQTELHWEDDPDLPSPSIDLLTIERQYYIKIDFALYETRSQTRPDPEEITDPDTGKDPEYTCSYRVPYTVKLAAKWVR